MAQINFGLLNTDIPAQIGAIPGNALAMRRQIQQQEEDRAAAQEGRQMQNALARMQMTKAQSDMDEEAAYKAALGGVQGGNYEQEMPSLMQASPSRAMGLQKTLTDRQKAIVEMRKSMTDVQEKKIGMYREHLTEIQTPEQMAQWYVSQRNDPDLVGVQWPTTLDETLTQLQEASNTPQGFGKFKLAVAGGLKGFLEMNKPSEFERTMTVAGMSPAEQQAAARARIGKETTHAPSASITNYGQPVSAIDPSTGQAVLVQFGKDGTPKVAPFAPYNATAAEAEGKKARGAKTAIQLLDEAGQWIDRATGSGIGALRDRAGRLIGVSSEASQAAARLSTLQGALMMAQPRMEGPQSNLDVALYERMAGRIGDPAVPSAEKRAAMDTIRALHQKYVVPGSASSSARSGKPSVNARGWSLHTDANGNQAYVSPDGSQFEEVR